MQSWWANNPFYAGTAGYNYNYQAGNQYTNAAARSGVVNVGGYINLHPANRGIGIDPSTMANPRNSPHVPYDQFGYVKQQKGDVELALVLMGGYGMPGQALMPTRGKDGRFEANEFSKWLIRQGAGGITLPYTRYRRSGVEHRSTGWQGILSTSNSSNKAYSLGGSGRGQSSEDSTVARYSTEETRLGTRAQFTDEEWQEEGAKYGRSWAGFKTLPDTGKNPYLQAELGTMYKRENPNVGFARRVKSTYL
jgi:hypothetical protein